MTTHRAGVAGLVLVVLAGVALQTVAADDRPLRTGARVQAEVGVVMAAAILDHDVMAAALLYRIDGHLPVGEHPQPRR